MDSQFKETYALGLENWEVWLGAKGPETQKKYTSNIRSYFLYCSVQNISPSDASNILKWLNYLHSGADAIKYSAKTLTSMLSPVVSFFEIVMQTNVAPMMKTHVYPTLEGWEKTEPVKSAEVFTQEHLSQIMNLDTS